MAELSRVNYDRLFRYLGTWRVTFVVVDHAGDTLCVLGQSRENRLSFGLEFARVFVS